MLDDRNSNFDESDVGVAKTSIDSIDFNSNV